MIVVCAQWQSEVMTVLQGDFEEELRRMSLDRCFDRPAQACLPLGMKRSAREPAITAPTKTRD